MSSLYRLMCGLFIISLIIVGIVLLLFFLQSLGKENQETEIPREEGEIGVYFCPLAPCEQELLDKINQSVSTIHCAFYNLNVENVISLLEQKSNAGIDVKIIIDADNSDETEHLDFVRYDTRSAYMHDKFCIFDEKEISTGSMNPTVGDTTENHNNLLFLASPTLARNYEAEFQSFWDGNFGSDEEVIFPKIMFNNFTIENYFCPEDDCETQIASILQSATTSIKFMQFSFTSDTLGNILLEKADSIEGIEIEGIFEKMQESKYSEYGVLKNAGLDVSLDGDAALLHHKVFIIDDAIVITGSMNPSKNGNENNDENILIIHDKDIALLYVEEFERVRKNNSS